MEKSQGPDEDERSIGGQNSEMKDKESILDLNGSSGVPEKIKVNLGQSRVQDQGQGQGREKRVRDESPVGSNSSNSLLDSQEEVLMKAVFSNPIILDTVLDFFPSAKTFRLVAKSWNEVALSGKPRLNLKINSFPYSEDMEEFENLIDTLDSRLGKSLSLKTYDTKTADDDEENIGQADPQAPTWLLRISARIGSTIQKLSIFWGIEILRSVYYILSSDSTPNLETLTITLDKVTEESLSPLLEDVWSVIPTQAKLKTLHFSCYPEEEEDRIPIFSTVSTFFRSLLAASPELKSLGVTSFFCPSLEGNKGLKTFRFHSTIKNTFPGEEDGRSSIQCYNMNHLTQILGVVKDSLETLQVGYRRDKPNSLKMGRIIPPMAKLKVFVNGMSHCASGINCNLRDLWKDRMPSLERLKIVFDDVPTKKNTMRQIIRLRNEGIIQLELSGVGEDDTQYLSLLKKHFPSLERLDLLLEAEDEEREDYLGEFVGTVFELCSTLGLRHLGVKTGFSYSMSGMVEALWERREELFSGLKTLELINNKEVGDFVVKDNLGPKEQVQFQQVLMQSTRMERVLFKGFLLRCGHASRIFKFITDNQLPIKFLDDDE